MSEHAYDKLAVAILWPGQVHSCYLAFQKLKQACQIMVSDLDWKCTMLTLPAPSCL
jgi:hypothetical protein